MRGKRWFLFFLFMLIGSVLIACSGGENTETAGESEENKSSEESREGEKVLRFLNPDEIRTMDPSLATDETSFIYLGATMEGLYRLGEDGSTVPGIATHHDVSEDGLTWTFHLREDAVWENGDPVTAHDFVYSWRRAVDPATGSEYGGLMMNGVIKNATAVNNGDLPPEELGVRAEDDYTLVVELENPIAYFESLTIFGTFLPLNQKFVEEQGDQFATSSENLLFNGPYKLANWSSTSNSWELVKNDTYWDADAVKMDRLTFQVVKDPQTAVDLYLEGSVDRADLTSELVNEYINHEDFTITPDTFVHYLKFNQTAHEALANKNIRAAISRAFDKEALVNNILNNGSLVANGLVPKDFVRMPDTGEDFREASGDLVTYDVALAQKYWEKGLQEVGTDRLEFELLADDDETTRVMVEYLANQLSTNLPGLKINIRQVPKPQRLDMDGEMDYELQITRWGPDFLDPFTFLNVWVTDGGRNNTGFSNPEYDRLLEETKTIYATDNVARYQNFLEAEKLLFEEAVIAPIFQASRAQLVSPKIEGVYVNPFGPTYEYKWADVAE